MQNQLSRNDSTTHHGPSTTPATINSVFEALSIAYPFFLRGLDGDRLVAAKRMWEAQLHNIPSDVVGRAVKRSLSEYPGIAPTVGQFVSICKSLQSSITPRLQLPNQSDKGMAKDAVAREYYNRLCHEMGLHGPNYHVDYEGDFDVYGVVKGAEIPTGSNLSEHQRCWSDLFRSFNQRWANP